MVRVRLCGFAMLAVGFYPGYFLFAQDAGRLTFRTLVSNLLMQTSPFAKSKPPEDSASVTLPGRLFTPPLVAPLIERPQADRSTPERAFASMRSANTVNDHAWIVENFVPAERAEIQKMLSDASMEKRNQDYYKTIRSAEITGTALLRGFTILLVREETDTGTARRVPVTLARTPSGWMLTNALSNDSTFDVVFGALRSGTVEKQ